MAYTVTKKTNYGSRVSSSFKGIGTGFVLLIAATALLWWNEGRAVHRSQDIKEVGKNATHVESIESVAPDGQLIHANGTAETADIISDGTFGVSVNALSLIRDVEYYQWEEHSRTETKEKIGGTKEEVTTYTYERAWVSHPINSSDFADPDYRGVNSTLAGTTFDAKTQLATNVKFGAYTMPENFIGRVAGCAGTTPTDLSNIDPALLADLNRQIAATQPASANAIAEGNEWVHVSGNTIYLGRTPGNPAVGDIRVTFKNSNPTAVISLIAVVNGNTFTKYTTKNGANDSYISSGTKSLEDMMTSAEESNTIMTWLLRIFGTILVCAGLRLIFDILVTLLKVLPFLANILNWGVKLICNVLGTAWSLIVIALAWIWYRPWLGIALLVIAGALIYFLVIKGKGKTPTAPMAAPEA